VPHLSQGVSQAERRPAVGHLQVARGVRARADAHNCAVIWEIILRDFWGAILHPLVTPYRRSNVNARAWKHLNPHLFEASDHAIYRTKKRAK
jgi:hypothetical protein